MGRILVVDDELKLRKVLVEALQEHGYNVTACGSGNDALAELQANDFDLLLTDLMMPGMDGIALLKAALKVDPQLVGIILTGQGTIQTAVDAMQIGAFDYVLKPFRLQHLLPVMTRALNSRQLRLENLQLRETVAIHELTQTIAFTLDPQTVMSKLTEAALAQTDADEVSVLLPTADGTQFYVAAARGEHQVRLLGERIPFDRSIASWVARERTPVILNGEVDDDRFIALWPRPDIRSSISVPMLVANKLVGVLSLIVINRNRPFALGQMKALSILAGTAATALESASLYTQVLETEQKYRSIFDNATEGLFQTALDGRLLTANPEFARILGYESPAEAIETITDVRQQVYVNPVDRIEAARLKKETRSLMGFELQALRKDGRKIWLSVNRRAIRDQSGDVLYFEGSIQDVTQRRHAEEERAQLSAEFEKQTQRLNNIVASVPGVVWEAWGHPDGNQTDFVSDYVKSMVGYSVEEWLSTPNFWLNIIHSDDRDRVSQTVAKAFESGNNCTVEFRWITRDGRELWVESNSVVVADANGKPVGLRGVNTDISERKAAEEALKRSESQLTEAQRQAHIGSWNWDLVNNSLTWSDEHYRIFGVKRNQFDVNFDEGIMDLIHPEDRELVRREVANTIETKEPFNFFYRVVRPQGDERIIHSSGSVEYDDQGISRRMFGSAQDVTERERIGQALRQSEERYRDLVEKADDLIYEHDLKGHYTACNRAGERLTGYTLEESLKLNLSDTVAPEYLDTARDMLRRKLAGESVTAYELVIVAKDGRGVPVEVNTRLVLKQGVPVGVQGIARDITQRKRVEEIQALRATHALFRADVSAALAVSRAPFKSTLASCVKAMVLHLDAAFARIWTLNPDEQVLELQASAGMYTHTDGAHSRVPVGSFKIGKIAENRAPHITNEVQNDERVSDKEWARREGMVAFAGYPLVVDDRTLGVMAMFSRQPLAEDTLDALASVADLISQGIERKRAEEALGESEERYRLLFESNPQPMWVYDLETLAFLAVNESAVQRYGYSSDEFLAMTIKDIRPPEDIPALYNAIGASGEGVDTSGSWRHVKKDGSMIDVEISSHSLVFDGRKSKLILSNDITERLRLESALLSSEAQLRQSQKLEAIGQLAGGVAHDFNNLLTAINGYSALALRRVGEDHPISSHLHEISKAGDRAANLTRQLLAFGRKQLLQPLSLNLNDNISDMTKLLKRLIGEDVQLLTRLDPQLQLIKADPGQIEQVLVNLVVNARDALPRGGIITIETSNTILDGEYATTHVGVTAGRYVLLSVSDTGTGMDQETQARIFEPFFTTKEKGKGTGLGLSTVYGIVKQTGGSLWVYSEVGEEPASKFTCPKLMTKPRSYTRLRLNSRYAADRKQCCW